MQITREHAMQHIARERAEVLAGLQIISFIESAGDPHIKLERMAGDDQELVELAAMLQGHLLGLRNIAIILGGRSGVSIFREWGVVKGMLEQSQLEARQAAEANADDA